LIFILHILINYFLNRIYADPATAKAICSTEGFSAYPTSLHILFAENNPKKQTNFKKMFDMRDQNNRFTI
jgi:hypothetical protein